MLGALCNYITSANPSKFQPMNANYGILLQKNDKIEEQYKNKYGRKEPYELPNFKGDDKNER